MSKKISLLAVVLLCASGQICNIDIDTETGTPLREADAVIVIDRDASSDQASVEAEITKGISDVVLEDGQKVEVNGDPLLGTSGKYDTLVDAADVFVIEVTDPRRGTDDTEIAEPTAFEITAPEEDGDASLSGFTIEWSDVDPELEVRVLLTQELFGEVLRASVGREADDGAMEVSSSDIANAGFGQGKPLTITVTKIRRVDGIAGFDDGTIECRLSVSIDVNPAP